MLFSSARIEIKLSARAKILNAHMRNELIYISLIDDIKRSLSVYFCARFILI
jgi:hypothetical protein